MQIEDCYDYWNEKVIRLWQLMFAVNVFVLHSFESTKNILLHNQLWS